MHFDFLNNILLVLSTGLFCFLLLILSSPRLQFVILVLIQLNTAIVLYSLGLEGSGLFAFFYGLLVLFICFVFSENNLPIHKGAPFFKGPRALAIISLCLVFYWPLSMMANKQPWTRA